MMVKNEEARLATALESVHRWVDEIVVVDTGSTDRTVEIAEGYGAKVFHHPWENDFSKHRNQSVEHATGDWLVILDADEELDQDTAPQLRQLVHAPEEVGGYLFELYNEVTVGGETMMLHPRMFRNHRGFHYQGKVHNKPMVPGTLARSAVRLRHYGYNADPETMAAKHQRRLGMIRKWVEDEPDNFQARSYLAHTLLSQPETVAEAVEEAREALRLVKNTRESDKRYPHVYYPLINGLHMLGRDQELEEIGLECLQKCPYYPDPLFFMLWSDFRREAWEQVCQRARHFWELQENCRKNPVDFIFFENLTYDQRSLVAMRWAVAAARLERDDEAREAFGLIFGERQDEAAAKQAVQQVLSQRPGLALALTELARERAPQWSWLGPARQACRQSLGRKSSRERLELADRRRQEGRLEEAAEQYRLVLEADPFRREALSGLGWALEGLGRRQEAEGWLMQALNAHPGDAAAWRLLGEAAFARGDYAGARACLERARAQTPGEESLAARLEVCHRRLADAPPTVAQRPPKLVVFLVGGLTPELVRLPAPHFLMGTAWGEFTPPERPERGAALWASLYTGTGPEEHGLAGEPTPHEPLGLADLQVPTFWELMPAGARLGLMAVPLGHPPAPVRGWAVSGRPGGLLSPSLVEPAELAPRVLAAGYRADFALSEYEAATAAQRLAGDVRAEALLYQVERNKLKTALSLPAVDVLAIGFTALDHLQACRDLATYHTFAAYQQVYSWIEDLLAALRPGSYAVLSQHGYGKRGMAPERGGFYCLSWLKGENGQAELTDVAAELVRHTGGDASALGRPRRAA
jgi:tetratricopeptide (TPR) repeat protein